MGAALAWGLYESRWVDLVERDVVIARLPPALDGLRVLHLSDLHLGTLSLNSLALDRALAWGEGRRPDLVAITGDLVSRRGGKAKLEEALAALAPPLGTYAILGNHDVDDARDPFSRPTDLADLHERGAVLLRDASVSVDARGKRIEVVGLDPESHPHSGEAVVSLVSGAADLRILLAHFPEVVDVVRPGVFDLVLAGHLHGGQICVPTPRGKIRLAHIRSRYWEGFFDTHAGPLYVSRGLGTTFVPFRFFARPEATLLTLRTSD